MKKLWKYASPPGKEGKALKLIFITESVVKEKEAKEILESTEGEELVLLSDDQNAIAEYMEFVDSGYYPLQ